MDGATVPAYQGGMSKASDHYANRVDIVEVGPRDGFQSIREFIPTDRKKDIIRNLVDCGIKRMEATSFVSQSALPQMADAELVMSYAQSLPGLDCQVLVPSLRHAERALAAGAQHLSFVVSVSERHNLGNVRRTPQESVAEYAEILASCSSDVAMRINIATAFDCPHTGRVSVADVLALMSTVLPLDPHAEFALCDTTGRADPQHVATLFSALRGEFGAEANWAFHAHDTFGMGLANIWSAYGEGVRTFDAAIAGVGGCPYAPGAKGNVATEDVVWLFESSGIATGIDRERLVSTSRVMESMPGAELGGRVREALAGCEALLARQA